MNPAIGSNVDGPRDYHSNQPGPLSLMEEQRMLVWSGQGDQRGRMRLEGGRQSQRGEEEG